MTSFAEQHPIEPSPETGNDTTFQVSLVADRVLTLLHDSQRMLDIDLGQDDPNYVGVAASIKPYYMQEGDQVGYWKIETGQATDSGEKRVTTSRLERIATNDGHEHTLLAADRLVGLTPEAVALAKKTLSVLDKFNQEDLQAMEAEQARRVQANWLQRVGRTAFSRILPRS